MRKCVARAVVIEVCQWRENGDHPLDDRDTFNTGDGPLLGEGKIVRLFRNPGFPGDGECAHCGQTLHVHGWIDEGGEGRVVCPGDYVITAVDGQHYPIKPDVFAAVYHGV